MNSCSSSGCHGGGAAQHDECITWLKKDFHSRSFATLTTARSARMAEVLKMDSPAQNASCTVCHAPFQTVPATEQKTKLDITAGVSCESCHAPAESWLLSHTRTDFSHADKVNAGMRDLENLYTRANSCVACHQNVSSNLLAAGHPELIFELDGQAVSEPKHWREKTNWSGAQTWLVGQAVALREMSWKLAGEVSPTENEINRFKGLMWLVYRVSEVESRFPKPPDTNFRPEKGNFEKAQKWSDEFAKELAKISWDENLTRKILRKLVDSTNGINDSIGQNVQARRAERLVIGLDRLILASDKKTKLALDSELNKLYSLVQSLPDFDSQKFATALENFSRKLQEPR
ncbi:MAG: multiheme c-type cytochrome [Verrucomicrobiota bacterium]